MKTTGYSVMLLAALAATLTSRGRAITTSNMCQQEATANFEELETIETNMSDDMWTDLAFVQKDVMHSGYWLIICLDIQESWDLCRLD